MEVKAPTLGGIAWAHNAISQDYCLAECVAALKDLCDQVVILDIGSTDLTDELVKAFEDEKTTAICLGKSEWERYKGREKIAQYQNLAMAFLNTDYYIISQADEVLHEDDFQKIRDAIATRHEGYIISRINLWGSVYKKLNVPQERKPCSSEVIRIAKVGYISVDDGENIQTTVLEEDWKLDIRLYHFGFVRNKYVMRDKIIHMQKEVFELENYDAKLDNMFVFDWTAWFKEEDLVPIEGTLPKYAIAWAQERERLNNK